MQPDESPGEAIPLVSIPEAVAEVRRWLEEEGVDPEGIFTAAGETVVRYRDLIGHLEQETPDGRLLRFAISRGRSFRQARRAEASPLLQITPNPDPPDPPPGG